MNESSIAILVVRVRGWQTANRNWVENCKSTTAIDNKNVITLLQTNMVDRFRSNFVVKGDCPAFEEQTWSRVTIGSINFTVSSIKTFLKPFFEFLQS